MANEIPGPGIEDVLSGPFDPNQDPINRLQELSKVALDIGKLIGRDKADLASNQADINASKAATRCDPSQALDWRAIHQGFRQSISPTKLNFNTG